MADVDSAACWLRYAKESGATIMINDHKGRRGSFGGDKSILRGGGVKNHQLGYLIHTAIISALTQNKGTGVEVTEKERIQ